MFLIILTAVIGFYTAFSIGSNDGANSMADAVGSRAISLMKAVLLGALFEFLGAVLVGSHVSNTIRKGIIDVHQFADDPMFLAYGMVCALLATAVWLHGSSLVGMPVSTTHSIVGAVFGFGLIFGGASEVNWGKLGQIVASWFISPVAGCIMAYLFFKWISKSILAKDRPINEAVRNLPFWVFVTFATVILATIMKGLKNIHLDLTIGQSLVISAIGGGLAALFAYLRIRSLKGKYDGLPTDQQLLKVEKLFAPLVIITSCSVAFAHGANDVANAVGPMAAVVEIVTTNHVPEKVGVDFWVLCLGGLGIAAGVVILGRKVIQTVGQGITELTPSRGVAADIATSITVLICSRIGLPISTTHTLIGAIIGIGLARGIAGVNLRLLNSIFFSWIVTIPVAAGLTVFFFSIVKWLIL